MIITQKGGNLSGQFGIFFSDDNAVLAGIFFANRHKFYFEHGSYFII